MMLNVLPGALSGYCARPVVAVISAVEALPFAEQAAVLALCAGDEIATRDLVALVAQYCRERWRVGEQDTLLKLASVAVYCAVAGHRLSGRRIERLIDVSHGTWCRVWAPVFTGAVAYVESLIDA